MPKGVFSNLGTESIAIFADAVSIVVEAVVVMVWNVDLLVVTVLSSSISSADGVLVGHEGMGKGDVFPSQKLAS